MRIGMMRCLKKRGGWLRMVSRFKFDPGIRPCEEITELMFKGIQRFNSCPNNPTKGVLLDLGIPDISPLKGGD